MAGPFRADTVAPMSRRPVLVAAFAVGFAVTLAAVAGGCASDDPIAGATEPDTDTGSEAAEVIEIPDDALDFTGESEVTVTIQDNRFEQREIVVDPGTQVTWLNEGRQTHNVTPSEEDSFVGVPTADLEPDETAARTFDDPGDYPYFCSLHGTARQGQTGRVIVVTG